MEPNRFHELSSQDVVERIVTLVNDILSTGALTFTSSQKESFSNLPPHIAKEPDDLMEIESDRYTDYKELNRRTVRDYINDARIVDGGILTGDLHRELIHRLGWSNSQLSRWSLHEPVSYTHLTLPTILLV